MKSDKFTRQQLTPAALRKPTSINDDNFQNGEFPSLSTVLGESQRKSSIDISTKTMMIEESMKVIENKMITLKP